LTADISSKSASRAIATIREHGVDNVVSVVRGKLASDRIEKCDLAALESRCGAKAAWCRAIDVAVESTCLGYLALIPMSAEEMRGKLAMQTGSRLPTATTESAKLSVPAG
jgi:hypothetical protein